MNYLFITSSRGGKMLQDSEGFKYYNKNGLYVCVDYQIVTFFVFLYVVTKLSLL